MRSRREKYCGAGITDALSHLLLKRKGGRDFTPSGRDIAGILDGDISGYAGS